jgi:CRISPR/Cas system-associated exonuclease Cas4 (RecB family)
MSLPALPLLRPLTRISPTLYEALLTCKSKAAWIALGDKKTLPAHPKALLGICFHSVMTEAHKRRFDGRNYEVTRQDARLSFDAWAQSEYQNSHPLLRAKFASPQRLPFYNLFRERAALGAADVAQRTASRISEAHRRIGRKLATPVEYTLVSKDGLLVGRPDILDLPSAEVLDYKSGAGPDAPHTVSPSEMRQLLLYTYLALDNGLNVSKATIVHPNSRVTVPVARAEAEREANAARHALAEFNNSIGKSFNQLAQPSPTACKFCPCSPICDKFWESSTRSWSSQVGTHIEAQVTAKRTLTVQGTDLSTFDLLPQRGTEPGGPLSLEQVPGKWLAATGADNTKTGDILRIVNGHRIPNSDPAVVRVDRVNTAVWRLPSMHDTEV